MSHISKKNALFGRTTDVSSPGLAEQSAPVMGSKTAGLVLKNSSLSSAQSRAARISPAVKQQKMKEATEAYEKATRYMQTSVFQWTPDYIGAATMYERAATSFVAACEFQKACEMFEKASKANEAQGVLSAAAVTLRKASEVAKQQLGDPVKCAQYLKQSAELWGTHGEVEKYSDNLAKAAKELEEALPEEAKSLYCQAIDIVVPESTPYEQLPNVHPYILETLRQFFTFLVRRRDLGDALNLARRMELIFRSLENETTMCKVMVSITIIQLALGDSVLASRTYVQSHLGDGNYLRSKECELAEQFVNAFEHIDVDLLDAAQNNQTLFFLDREVQNLAKSLSLLTSYSSNNNNNNNNNNSKKNNSRAGAGGSEGAAAGAEKDPTETRAALFSSKPKSNDLPSPADRTAASIPAPLSSTVVEERDHPERKKEGRAGKAEREKEGEESTADLSAALADVEIEVQQESVLEEERDEGNDGVREKAAAAAIVAENQRAEEEQEEEEDGIDLS